jgi:hypothetical protein
MITSSKLRLTGHVAGTGEMRNAYRVLVGKSEGTRPHGDKNADERILKWMLEGKVHESVQ